MINHGQRKIPIRKSNEEMLTTDSLPRARSSFLLGKRIYMVHAILAPLFSRTSQLPRCVVVEKKDEKAMVKLKILGVIRIVSIDFAALYRCYVFTQVHPCSEAMYYSMIRTSKTNTCSVFQVHPRCRHGFVKFNYLYKPVFQSNYCYSNSHWKTPKFLPLAIKKSALFLNIPRSEVSSHIFDCNSAVGCFSGNSAIGVPTIIYGGP